MRFKISTSKRHEVIDITDKVKEIVDKSGVDEGLCNVFVRNATAAIIINENYDPNIGDDFLDAINKIIPDNAGYRHDRIDGNGGAHIKSSLVGPSETIPISKGELCLGTWQDIMLVEFDGPRDNREVVVKISRSEN